MDYDEKLLLLSFNIEKPTMCKFDLNNEYLNI